MTTRKSRAGRLGHGPRANLTWSEEERMRRFMPTRILLGAMAVVALLNAPVAGRMFYAAPSYVPGGGTGLPLSNGLTPQTPFLISDFWDVAPVAGDTLVLLDGEYRGADSMIVTPYTLNMVGTVTNPIRIIAQNDGGVLINGDDDGDGIGDHQTLLISAWNMDPVDANGDGEWDRTSIKEYISIEGINVCNSNTGVVTLKGTRYARLYRVCAWNAPIDSSSGIFNSNYSDYSIFEDCAGWGAGRKIFVPFGQSSPGVPAHHNTFRRCFGRWEISTRTDPKMTFSCQYGTNQAQFENCIGTWDEQPGAAATGVHGIFSYDTSYHGENQFLGCIAYLKAVQNATVMRNLFHLAVVERFTLENCLSFVDNDHARAPLMTPFYVTGLQVGNILRNVTSLGGRGISLDASRTTVNNALVCHALDRDAAGNPQDDNGVSAISTGSAASHVYFFDNDENWEHFSCPHYPNTVLSPEVTLANDPNCPDAIYNEYRVGPGAVGIDPALDTAGRSFVSAFQSPHLRGRGIGGDAVGATIWFRYVDGVLTNKPLWPWPMNRRILDAMTDYYNEDPVNRPPPINVTKEVFELNGGSLPGDYNGDGVLSSSDLFTFVNCFRGATGSPPANCETFDLDQDTDVDLADYALFQQIAGALD
jgi:hypothetical protein